MGRVGMPARKETMRQLIPVAIHFVPMSALLTIGFGALLYLVMGDFDSNLLIGRTWGLIILAALILAVALFTFGMTVVIGASSRTLVHLKEDTCTHANEMGELQRTFNRGQVVALVWGLAILALMVIATEGV
jgi:amino acid transporter